MAPIWILKMIVMILKKRRRRKRLASGVDEPITGQIPATPALTKMDGGCNISNPIYIYISIC